MNLSAISTVKKWLGPPLTKGEIKNHSLTADSIIYFSEMSENF